MRQVVKDFFLSFSERFEGAVTWMYLDILGLVTTGIGNLIDPNQPGSGNYLMSDAALSLPWVYKDTGEAASRDDVVAEWMKVKLNPTAAHDGHRVLEKVTNLRLTESAIKQLVGSRLQQNYQYMVAKHFPDFDSWPAEAQLATLSMAWACGANWPALFGNCKKQLLALDFANAAVSCHMNDTHNAGLVPRNAANKTLFETAAHAAFEGLDYDVLRYNGTEYKPDPMTEEAQQPIVHPELFSAAYEDYKNENPENE